MKQVQNIGDEFQLNPKKTTNFNEMKEEVSESSIRLRAMIEQAIADHKITRDDYDKIINIATEDGYIDKHEKALLSQLQQMIEDRLVKFVI